MSESIRRLKVLQVITHFALGGATETVLTTCREADAAEFDIAILCGKTAANEQSLHQEAVESGVRVYEVPSLRRALAPAWEWRAHQDLVRWFQNNPCDIVHTSGSKAGILGRLAAAKAGVPAIVHTVFGWGHHAHMSAATRRLYITLERRAARVTNRILAVSEANKAKGLADGIGVSSQYEVVYNGIDVAQYRDVQVDVSALRRQLGLPPDAPLVGTVSRLAPQKAPQDFLQTAALIRAQRPDVHFLFVGGGPQQAEFEKGIRERNLEGVVHFLGYRQDVAALLRLFDVFLLTSLWEGLPMVILQAMCASLPCVATAVDGTPEVVVSGTTGFLAPAHDCGALAEHVIALLKSPGLRQTFGNNAVRSINQKFSNQEMVRRIENVYRNVASESLAKGTNLL